MHSPYQSYTPTPRGKKLGYLILYLAIVLDGLFGQITIKTLSGVCIHTEGGWGDVRLAILDKGDEKEHILERDGVKRVPCGGPLAIGIE